MAFSLQDFESSCCSSPPLEEDISSASTVSAIDQARRAIQRDFDLSFPSAPRFHVDSGTISASEKGFSTRMFSQNSPLARLLRATNGGNSPSTPTGTSPRAEPPLVTPAITAASGRAPSSRHPPSVGLIQPIPEESPFREVPRSRRLRAPTTRMTAAALPALPILLSSSHHRCSISGRLLCPLSTMGISSVMTTRRTISSKTSPTRQYMAFPRRSKRGTTVTSTTIALRVTFWMKPQFLLQSRLHQLDRVPWTLWRLRLVLYLTRPGFLLRRPHMVLRRCLNRVLWVVIPPLLALRRCLNRVLRVVIPPFLALRRCLIRVYLVAPLLCHRLQRLRRASRPRTSRRHLHCSRVPRTHSGPSSPPR